MPDNATSPDVTTVKASLMGSDTVEVTLTGPGTVADVLQQAADQLGVELDTNRVAAVRNGDQVDHDTEVRDGDQVTGAPRVQNGSVPLAA